MIRAFRSRIRSYFGSRLQCNVDDLFTHSITMEVDGILGFLLDEISNNEEPLPLAKKSKGSRKTSRAASNAAKDVGAT